LDNRMFNNGESDEFYKWRIKVLEDKEKVLDIV
jgi:hypothetical protein